MAATPPFSGAKLASIWYALWVVLPLPLSLLVPTFTPHHPIEVLAPAFLFVLGAIASFWWLRRTKSVVYRGLLLVPVVVYIGVPVFMLVHFSVQAWNQ